MVRASSDYIFQGFCSKNVPVSVLAFIHKKILYMCLRNVQSLSQLELQFSNHLALHPWIDDSLSTLVFAELHERKCLREVVSRV